jgi:hypothetical protein
MSVIYNFGISGTKNYLYKEILNSYNKNKKSSYSNDVANWYAIAKNGTFMITFYDTDENKFYKNVESWAKRVSQLMKKGY